MDSSQAKRNLRVLKWVGTVPAIGACTFCNRQFKVPMTAMKWVADAQESLRIQFAGHKCSTEDINQAVVERSKKLLRMEK
jgi:hypothetical protein